MYVTAKRCTATALIPTLLPEGEGLQTPLPSGEGLGRGRLLVAVPAHFAAAAFVVTAAPGARSRGKRTISDSPPSRPLATTT